MVRIKKIGEREFLQYGRDGVTSIPLDQIKSIDHRRKSYGSWVTITLVDGTQESPYEGDDTDEFIEFLEANDDDE